MAEEVIHQRGSRADDEKLAMEFLTGRYIRENGRETHRYLKPGSNEELRARVAFTRILLKSDLPKSIRLSLTMLFNPFAREVEPRELIFKYRSRGRRGDVTRDVQLATDVALKVESGMKLEAAIREVMVVHCVKRATAFKAWKEHGKAWLADLRARRTVARFSKEISAPIAGLGIPYPRV